MAIGERKQFAGSIELMYTAILKSDCVTTIAILNHLPVEIRRQRCDHTAIGQSQLKQITCQCSHGLVIHRGPSAAEQSDTLRDAVIGPADDNRFSSAR